MADGINVLGGRWVPSGNSKGLMPELCSPEEMQARIEKLEEQVDFIMNYLREAADGK